LTAYQRGYQDGLFTGASDARRGQSYFPERSHFFQGGNYGYSSIYGNRDTYQQAYRDGFLSGYQEGYQNWQKYFSGGYFHP
jgi:flagellar biosynthesis/type III secretory pathway protein FliH